MGRAVDWIAADADAGALADTATSQLPDGFVSQGAAPRNHADLPLLVNVTGRDADPAAAVRILPLAGRDDAGAIRSNQARLTSFHCAFHFDHVEDRDSLRDRHDQIEPRVHAFENGVRSER